MGEGGRKQKDMNNPAVEYLVEGDPWRVDDFPSLESEMKVKREWLAKFHWWAQQQPHLVAGWQIVRMLFGIDPLIPDTVKADSFNRIYSLEEIAQTMKADTESVESELDLIRISWEKYARTIPIEPEPEKAEAATIKPAIEALEISCSPLSEEEKNYIRFRGFSLDIFEYTAYDTQQRQMEIRWFHDRLVELRKVFDEPMAKTLARQAIIKELNLRRYDEVMMREVITSKVFNSTNTAKQEMETSYQSLWAQIEEMCPYIKGSAGKITTFGVFSDMVGAVREFHANKNNEKVDGLLTNYEIQIEMRQSDQAPVRYRPGLIAAVNEAKAGLFNPNFQRTITDRECRALDMGFQKAMEYLNEKDSVKLVNLLSDGKDGEYPPLAKPIDLSEIDLEEDAKQQSDHEEENIVVPEESIQMDEPKNP